MPRCFAVLAVRLLPALPVLVLTPSMAFTGDEPAVAKKPIPVFETDVRPIFKARCERCHGERRQRADLNLAKHATIVKGGESGPVIAPGNLDKSLLWELVQAGKMPPSKKDRLSTEEVAAIRRWIETGAQFQTVTASVPEVTQHDIEPMMLLRCAACHGLRKQEAGLDLRTRASMLRGGKSGPAFVPGKPEESLILKKIHSGAMPPRKQLIQFGVKPMPPDDVDRLTKWIRLGAPEIEVKPDVATTDPDPLISDKDRAFWSFQPVMKPAVPEATSPSAAWRRIRNPIDAFVLRKLEENDLTFSPEADRLTLLRRACFDLTGLPPTPEEMEAFDNDDDPCAYEKLIDRLLASPRYGERWGRFWLDIAGYADSEGKRSADPIRPHAWRYRDYVVRALNADKPYDRFLLEQIAGDELADYENAAEITDEMMDNLIATGFLRLAPDGTGSDIVNFVPERMEVIADEIQIFGASILGLTVQCARCHSHKYDPIPQRDYYRLVATFKGAFDVYDWLKPAIVRNQARSSMPRRELKFLSEEEKKRWQEYQDNTKHEIARLKAKLAKNKKDRDLQMQVRSLETASATEPAIRALWDRGAPSLTHVYRRGDHLQPDRLVGPGVISVLTDGKTPFEVKPPWPGSKKTGRRLALARWLTSRDHPLTARVMVNRIWKHHFGTGIVKSLDNFGRTGTPPTHPELLDWLAAEFVDKSWSIKEMHRLLMTSTTYRQSSAVTARHDKIDLDNRWLARMPMRRMDAEEVYDTILYVSDLLDEKRYGPPDSVEVRRDGLVTPLPTSRGYRRSLYVRQRRSQMPTLLENFDLPQMNPNCVTRPSSTVAAQALHLLNNTKVRERAAAFAAHVRRRAGSEPCAQVDWGYRAALSRPPTKDERAIGVNALQELRASWRTATSGRASPEEVAAKALSSYCHAILNSASFLYID